MSALLRLAVALLMALVGLGTMSGPTHAATDSFAYHYTYDSAATLSTLTDDETERGPPITCDDAATPAAVDLSSRGSSACLKTAALDATAYDSPVLLAQVGGAGTTTQEPVQSIDGDLSAVQRWHVAAKTEVGGGGQAFTHFTDVDGVAGIAGVGPLKIGDSVGVGGLKFGQGGNSFLSRAPGDNFVTDLGLDATPRQLEGIGVFGAKQQYAIQFSQEAALTSGVRPVMVRENIFTIPGGSCITGACTVTRVR